MSRPHEPNSVVAARFIAGTRARRCEPEIVEAAKMCLVDWCGVALGAWHEPAAQAVRRLAQDWGGAGAARILLGGRTTPAVAALVNGTMAHCLDFDDTHVGSLAHLSGPTWAATLALASHGGRSGAEALAAFVTGFEVGARLGGNEFGAALTERGFHSTGVVGRLAAAAAACGMLGLDEQQAAHALGLAATQAAGLTGSFGTMAKPFHAGKAAMDGVLSAQLSAHGFEAAPGLLDTEAGLAGTLIQDRSHRIGPLEFSGGWELTRNTFKPYASCLLTHPAIDAARRLAGEVGGSDVREVRVLVHPLAPEVAGKPAPRTALEAKFSLAYCVAIGLRGYGAQAQDFSLERLNDPAVRALLKRIRVQAHPAIGKTSARMEVELADGRKVQAEVPVALGNPENPMSWDAMEAKFMSLVEPVLAERARPLWSALRRFDQPGAFAEALALVESRQG